MQQLNNPIFVQGLASSQPQNVVVFWDYFLGALSTYYRRTLSPLKITREQAQDLSKDVMIKVYTKFHLFAGWNRGQIMNYVFKAAARSERRYVRREIKKMGFSLAQLRVYAPWIGPATLIDQNGEVIEVASHPLKADPSQRVLEAIYAKRALLKLDKRERTVFLLRYILELSITDTARRTGLSRDNVKVISLRAQRKLQALFENACANLSSA